MAVELYVIFVLSIMAFSRCFALKHYYMDQRCGQVLELTEGMLELTHSWRYKSNMDCILTIRAPLNQRMLIRIYDIDIHRLFGECGDWLQLYDEYVDPKRVLTNHLCGSREPHAAYVSSGRNIAIRFVSDHRYIDNGFTLIFNSFYMAPCNATQFRCKNNRCIDKKLYCTIFDHCGDYSNVCVDYKWISVTISFAVIALVFIVLGILYFIRYRKKQARRAQTSPVVPLSYYPEQHPGGYPPQPQPGYPNQPPGGYPPQPYPDYPGPPPPGHPSMFPPPYPPSPSKPYSEQAEPMLPQPMPPQPMPPQPQPTQPQPQPTQP